MLQSQIQAHFQAHADLLLAGDVTGFGEMFSLPLPIHFPGGMTVVLDQESGRMVLNQMRSELLANGVVAIRPKISAVELPKADRFRVWIDWMEVTAEGVELPGSSIIYYCRKCPSGLRSEMIQYTHVSTPGLVSDQIQIARSA